MKWSAAPGSTLTVTIEHCRKMPATKAIVDPYVAQLNTYNNKVVGQTTVPIDTLQAFTAGDQRRQPAGRCFGLGAGAARHHDVDFHLSGAMTNKLMASGATPASTRSRSKSPICSPACRTRTRWW